MVRLTLSTAFVASLALSVFATPVERASFVTVPLKKVGSATAKALVENDLRRLANINSRRKLSSDETGSGSITNVLVSYLAPVEVGGQTYGLIVDTGSSNTWLGANQKYNPTSTSTKFVALSIFQP
jgi:hypothetical protein